MATIEIKSDPSPAELRIFALLWFIFFCGLGWLTPGIAGGLLPVAGVTLVCAVLALTFSREDPAPVRLAGLLTPAALLALWAGLRGAGALGLDAPAVRTLAIMALSTVGVTGALTVLASVRRGRILYRWWMRAVAPIGWTIAHLLLGAVFYLVITPIGVVMRVAGRDPMQRGFDSRVQTYWVQRTVRADSKRYFRQF